MSQPLTPEQQALLQRVATGDLAADATSVRAAAADPIFAEALVNLQHTIARLDLAGHTERRVLQQATDDLVTLRPGLVRDTLHRLAGQAPLRAAPEPRRLRAIVLGLLAAAAAVGLWLTLRATETDTPNPRDLQQLGGHFRVELEGLVGDTLRWTCVPPAARYVVTVFDAQAPTAPLLDSQDLATGLRRPEWSLDAEQRAKLTGRQLRWRVEAFRPEQRTAESRAEGPLTVR